MWESCSGKVCTESCKSLDVSEIESTVALAGPVIK